MSNVGKKPVKIIEGVTVEQKDRRLIISGPKGTLESQIPSGISLTIQDNEMVFKKETDSHDLEKYLGLIRALANNSVIGVTKGFEKKLELSGVGYRARVDGQDLVLNVGYVNPVKITSPQDIKFSVEEGVITVAGANKQLVGDVATKIREARPPEPYKGKGIKYVDEKIRRKVGKAAKAVGGAK